MNFSPPKSGRSNYKYKLNDSLEICYLFTFFFILTLICFLFPITTNYTVFKLLSSHSEINERRSLLNIEMFLGFEFVGHVMETLTTDELGCGLRCLRNEKCLSYNTHTYGACQLSNSSRQSSPDRLRRKAGSTYYGKGRLVRSKSYTCM